MIARNWRFAGLRFGAALGLLAGCVVAVGGCGGATKPTVAKLTPFTDEDAHHFDNGADFISDPDAFEGQWADDWSAELDNRVGRADVVAAITVHTVRQDLDPNRDVTYRLQVDVKNEMFGRVEDHLLLTSRHEDAGFETIEGHHKQLLDHNFVMFVKWKERNGDVVPRWHLSSASGPMVRKVESLLEIRRKTTGARK